MTTFSFHVQGAYPRYNEFADKMPPEVANSMERDRIKRLNELNKGLVAAFALLGNTFEKASESFQALGKTGIFLKDLERITAWQRFSFENKIKR